MSENALQDPMKVEVPPLRYYKLVRDNGVEETVLAHGLHISESGCLVFNEIVIHENVAGIMSRRAYNSGEWKSAEEMVGMAKMDPKGRAN
jgi:hypothetical protein